MDRLFIKNLTAQACIGVHDWERAIKQNISIDLEMASDINRAAKNDDLADALNYHQVALRLTEAIKSSEFKLIESLAEHLVTILQKEFNITGLRLQLTKPAAIPNASAVGVIIERGML